LYTDCTGNLVNMKGERVGAFGRLTRPCGNRSVGESWRGALAFAAEEVAGAAAHKAATAVAHALAQHAQLQQAQAQPLATPQQQPPAQQPPAETRRGPGSLPAQQRVRRRRSIRLRRRNRQRRRNRLPRSSTKLL
jgi:hypothetical protein